MDDLRSPVFGAEWDGLDEMGLDSGQDGRALKYTHQQSQARRLEKKSELELLQSFTLGDASTSGEGAFRTAISPC